MAVELCAASSPENPPSPSSRGISPRISFSHDLGKYDVVPIEPHLPLNPSSLFASANFNFYSPNNTSFPHSQPSPADELFSNGVLLPLQALPPAPATNKKESLPVPTPPAPPPPEDSKAKGSSSTSSFWKFKRSRSFNCGSIYKGTLCPLLLSRSKSTGSNSSSKRSLVPKDERHPLGGVKQRSVSSPSYSVSGYHKPPLNKSYGSNAPTVSPVLNVSSGNLFGLGSLFTSIGKPGPDKIHKKKLLI